jgi:putative nucleotidyltransferase with HDIG domain
MIRENDLLRIKTLFNDYVSAFYTGNEKRDSAIRIKEVHTKNVALEILDIADSIGLDSVRCYMAETAAILHDIGRFEQFAKYQTYLDGKSENHAAMGVRAIRRSGIIGGLSAKDQDLILAVVEHHNKATLPVQGEERFLFFLKLLRDADKIDIWRVVTEHYRGFNANEAIDIGLPDGPEISESIVRSLMRGEIARVEDMKNLNDFKLLQMSWIFDLNFPRTFEIVKQRQYLEKIRDALPENFAVERAFASARNHREKNCPEKRNNYQCQIP